MSETRYTCPVCGFPSPEPACPLCAGRWDTWQVLYPALPLGDHHMADPEGFGEYLAQLPMPGYFALRAGQGLSVSFAVPPRAMTPAMAQAWSAYTRRQMALIPHTDAEPETFPRAWALVSSERILTSALHGDGMLALASHLTPGSELRIWLLGREDRLQARLRPLAAYHYGTESGVSDATPNPWGYRLLVARGLLFGGGGLAALGGGAAMLHAWAWAAPLLLGGGMLFVAGLMGHHEFFRLRSIPKEVLEKAIGSPLLSVALSFHGPHLPERLAPVTGRVTWVPLDRPHGWPEIRRYARPMPAAEVGPWLRPPTGGEAAAAFTARAYQPVPAPPPSRMLRTAPLLIGKAVATGEPVGIDPDAHGLVVGGSRSGKSSAVFRLLQRLTDLGDDAPGLFLLDPHLSLADAFLDHIATLPPERRKRAVRRLRIADPTRPAVVPLNLLTLDDYAWAGGALVELGRRIWDDYWGPRMQAALMGLFRLGHAWNMHRPDARMGLVHTVFMAYNRDFRDTAMQYLPPQDRINALALSALLGQGGGRTGSATWLTEVVSPIISKVMALELSPWLFDALHRGRFVDMARWIEEGAWVVARLSTGVMGRPGARLAAAVLYNVFEAVYRRTVSAERPRPFYVVVDEAQEIAAGMKLENPLSEGGKFGMRVFVLTQSLTMLRQIEGFEAVVQALLANTSTQMFFSPDPDDAETIERVLRSFNRFGPSTLDLPSLQCYLRARVEGRWQPPTLVQVEPLPSFDRARVDALIEEAIAAHPDDYEPPEERGQEALDALLNLLPPAQREALGLLLDDEVPAGAETEAATTPSTSDNRLGL